MNWIAAKIRFPLGRISPQFVAVYLARYTDPKSGWAASHWDDRSKTTRRRASLFDGTIEPAPVFDTPLPPPQEFTAEWIAAHKIADEIECGWPEPFINDLQRDPQPEPELFGGIVML